MFCKALRDDSDGEVAECMPVPGLEEARSDGDTAVIWDDRDTATCGEEGDIAAC